MIDPISDMLTRIRNANLVKKTEVIIPFSKIKFEVAKILEKEGFVKKVEEIEKNHKQIKIELKYKDKKPVIQDLKRISKPGRRIYNGYKKLPKILPSLGIMIVSTPLGLMTHEEAKEKKIGGEVICEIY